jgi:hypothetical protein
MPFGGLLALAPALISGGSALAGLFGGGSPASQVQMPQGYQMGQMPYADVASIQGTQQLGQYNVPGQVLPQYQQIAQQGVNNPYAAQAQQGANQTGQAGMASGAGLTGTAMSQLPGVNALMSLGFDPQQALYSQLQNQNQQQNAAILGQSGVAGTPYGAGVQQQANTNFNIDWQNQQLQRAMSGAQGAGSLLGSIGGATNTGLNQMQQGSQLPYNTSQGITGNQLGLLGQYGSFGQQAAQLPQQQIQDYLAYLAQGSGQQGVNNQTAQVGLNQAQQGFQQNQQMGSQLGGALAGLSKGWGNSGFGGSNFGGAGPGLSGAQGQQLNQQLFPGYGTG